MLFQMLNVGCVVGRLNGGRYCTRVGKLIGPSVALVLYKVLFFLIDVACCIAHKYVRCAWCLYIVYIISYMLLVDTHFSKMGATIDSGPSDTFWTNNL